MVFDKIANTAGKTDCISRLLKTTSDNHSNAKIGIGHTWWATCGEINDTNAHPHFDQNNNLAIIHNGIIINYLEIK